MIAINYQRIRYFIKTAETGSFSKAAALAYVSSQALTKQINQLEEELGGRLFLRSPQGVSLTRLGEYAYQRFSKLDQELEEAYKDIQEQAEADKEQVRIGIFNALPRETIVTPVITFLLGIHPEYQFHLELVELAEGRQKLIDGKLDLLITNTHEEDDWCGNPEYSFGSYDAQVIVSLLHPWAIKDSITVEDMKQETFLKMDMDSGHYKVPLKESFYENVPCKRVQTAKNFDTTFALLQQGSGFAIFPRAYAHMDLAKMKYFDYPGKTLIFHTALICHTENAPEGLEALIRDIREEYDLQEIM